MRQRQEGAIARDPAWWLDAVRREERRGELLGAFDVAEEGLAEHPDELALRYRAVLVLARAGATEEAARRFEEYRLLDASDEDAGALRARIAKDTALAHHGAERRPLALRAAELYDAVFARTRGYYPAINAATLWLIAGEAGAARRRAQLVLELLAGERDEGYWEAATAAEACLLLGDPVAAGRALSVAAGRNGGDFAALATTRRQLRLICETLGVDQAVLGALAGPGVVHYCGHRIATGGEPGRFVAGEEARVAARVAEVVARHRPGFAYGALAGGADILWAEALLAVECELHVVLPFDRDEFVAVSVAPCGPGWAGRFERCLQAARSVKMATEDAYLGDDVLFRYGSELAMGLALLRAGYLDADARQFALWDGAPTDGDAGTAIDVATWRRTGHSVDVISPAGEITHTDPYGPPDVGALAVPRDVRDRASGAGRVVGALLFGDVRGFSKLTDAQLATFATCVMGALAGVVAGYETRVWYRNTWGDAIFLVLADASSAASCALDLQDAIAGIDLARHGLPEHLMLRLGGHVGPVLPVHDLITDAQGFLGEQVSRTARIEPVTPPGAVFVTEPFAAAVALAGNHRHACDYVGHMQLAKNYGRMGMYRLRRATGGGRQPSDSSVVARAASRRG